MEIHRALLLEEADVLITVVLVAAGGIHPNSRRVSHSAVPIPRRLEVVEEVTVNVIQQALMHQVAAIKPSQLV